MTLSDRELDTAYFMARESLWRQSNVTREQANAAVRVVTGPAVSVAQIVDVTNRVCDFMRGAGRLK